MSITALLAILLVSTFVALGIVGVWAATSRLHWFVRAVAVLGILSPLLIAQALEPFLTLLVEATTIATGVVLWRVMQQWRHNGLTFVERIKTSTQFTVAAILLTIGLSAIVLAVGVYMPELNWNAWQSMLLIGVGSGLCVWFAQLGVHARVRSRILCPALVVGGILVAIPIAWFDWFVPSLVGWAGWPPESISGVGFLGIFDEERPVVAWFIICPSTCIIALSILAGLRVANTEATGQRVARAVATMVLCAVFLIPAFGWWVLVRPPEFVDNRLPESNAYGRIVELASVIDSSLFQTIDIDWDIVPKKSLVSPVADIQDELDLLHTLIRQPASVPVDYESKELPVDRAIHLRSTARAFGARGRLAILNGRPDEANVAFLDAVRLGFVARSRGLLVDGLVGMGCSSVGSRTLYEHRNRFSRNQCLLASTEVLSFVDRAEDYDDFKLRDRAWVQAAMGWHGRLQLSLGDLSGSSLLFSELDLRNQFLLERAVMRLVAIELALKAFSTDSGTWPESLSDLVPAYLPSVPIDPFNESHGTFGYTREDNGYRLYSVGANRTDEGGVEPQRGDGMFVGALMSGDLVLVSYFDDNDDPPYATPLEAE